MTNTLLALVLSIVWPGGQPAQVATAPRPAEPTAQLEAFLKDGRLENIPAQPFAQAPLTREQADAARTLILNHATAKGREERRAAFESKVVESAGVRMEYRYSVHGDKPQGRGRSLYISLHGGGGAPKSTNDQQWRNQQRLYTPAEGVYVAPRAPTDTWNLWHQGHIDGLLDRLIAELILFEDVDPDRVYLMGYSAGGDGVFQLAPRMADRFAAAAMMAGHPNETRPDGLRNLPFAIYMGAKDAAYNRNQIARDWKAKLTEMAAADPGGYPHLVTIYEEHGHWMERKDASSLVWMAGFTRDLRPTRIVWLQDDVTSRRFYWVCNPDPKAGQRIVVGLEGQTIRVHEPADARTLVLLLDDSMLDLDRPVTVKLGDTPLTHAPARRTIGALAGAYAERGDPRGIFSARLEVDLPATPGPQPRQVPRPTSP